MSRTFSSKKEGLGLANPPIAVLATYRKMVSPEGLAPTLKDV